MKRQVAHWVLVLVACEADEERSFIGPRLMKDRFVEVQDSYHSSSRLLPSNFAGYVESFEPLLERLRNQDVALVRSTTVARLVGRRKYDVDYIDHPDGEKGHTALFLDRSAKD